MKKITVSLILALAAFALQAQHFDSHDLYTTKSFSGSSPKKINSLTSHGNISVSEVPATQTRVEVYVRSNSSDQDLSKEEIQKRLDEYYTLDISLSGGVLNASARQKKDFPFNQSNLSISFAIYTPKEASSTLKTSHGNIELSGLKGAQDAVTSHGNLDIDNITGKVTGGTSHGNITVSRCSDDIDLSTDHGNVIASNCEGLMKFITSNGNVDLKDLKGKVHGETSHGNVTGHTIDGELRASTSHGDVNLDGMSCSVDASTDHGNISVMVKRINGEIAMSNINGNISLELPQGSGLNLDLEGRTVTVDGMQNFSGSKSKDLVKGSTNGGGTKISAKTDKEVNLTFR
jgi:hypothetical protein